MKVVWKFDDVDMNILSVIYDEDMIGYFRMDNEVFTFTKRRIPANALMQLGSEFNGALKEAKKIADV